MSRYYKDGDRERSRSRGRRGQAPPAAAAAVGTGGAEARDSGAAPRECKKVPSLGVMSLLSCAFVTAGEYVVWAIFAALDFFLGLAYYPLKHLRHWRYERSSQRVAPLLNDGEAPVGQRRKTVVVVGGNFGGLAALHEFEDDADFRVVLIDQRGYFEYTPGVLRLLCDPELWPTMARAIPTGTHEFILGTVTNVNKACVVVSSPAGTTTTIAFDYLILATGADYRQPITPSATEASMSVRANTWKMEAARLAAAERVLVLGGGAVGSELAAEVACYYPEKHLTIVDAAEHLVPLFPSETVQKAERWFLDQGVELLLGQKLQRWDEKSCTLASGRVVEADIVYVCFGMKQNSQCVASGDVSSCLGERRQVLVNDFLQVEGEPHMFAVGDVMEHPAREIKQAYYAEMNGKMAALNIIRLAKGEPLLKYPEALAGAAVMPLVYVVSLGRYDGSLGFNSLVLNGPLAALVKYVLEYTKVAQMEGRPIGHLIWLIGDAVTFFLSRTCIRPDHRD